MNIVMEDVIVRDATVADAPFLLSLARDAYRDVLAQQFSGWDDSIHGVRFAEKIASLPFRIVELHGENEIERSRIAGLPVRLHTFRLNRALRLYERHGFVVTARREDEIDLELTFDRVSPA